MARWVHGKLYRSVIVKRLPFTAMIGTLTKALFPKSSIGLASTKRLQIISNGSFVRSASDALDWFAQVSHSPKNRATYQRYQICSDPLQPVITILGLPNILVAHYPPYCSK